MFSRKLAIRALESITTSDTNGSILPTFVLCQSPVDTSSDKCAGIESAFSSFVVINIILSFMVVFLFSFTQKRVKLLPQFLCGRPGLVIPVNLLTHTKYRLIYVAIFGSMSSVFLNVITGSLPTIQTPDPYSQSVVSLLVTLLYVMLLCITYYPLFASVDTPIPIIGHIIGAFFATLLLVESIIREYNVYTGCSSGCQYDGLAFAVVIFSDVPILLLQFFVVVWFTWNIGYDIYLMVVPSKQMPPGYELLHDHLLRVRHRLRRQNVENEPKLKTGLQQFLFKVYPYDKGFKFPLRFLAGMVVSAVIIYQLSLTAMYNTIVVTVALNNFKNDAFEKLNALENQLEDIGFNESLDNIDTVVKVIGYGAVTLGSMLVVAIAIGIGFCVVQLFLTFRNVSNHLHQSTRGDLPNNFPSLQRSLMSSLRYPGYQIAYLVWAWIIYTTILVLVVVILLIGLALIILLINFVGPKIAVAIIGVAWTQIIYWSQYFITKFVFLQKAYPDSEHEVLNNRRLLHWFTYFFLFQNAFVGMFSTFFRVLLSLAFGLLTFSRLDKVLLMQGMEYFDAAHRTYIGMIHLDYTQNNSILNVFCHLLLEENRSKKQKESGVVEPESTGCSCCQQQSQTVYDTELENVSKNYPPRPYVSQRAYNRWRVAYTLIRNKQLMEFTGSFLNANRKKSLRERLDHAS